MASKIDQWRTEGVDAQSRQTLEEMRNFLQQQWKGKENYVESPHKVAIANAYANVTLALLTLDKK